MILKGATSALFLVSAVAAQSCSPTDHVMDLESSCGNGVGNMLSKVAFDDIYKGRNTIKSSCHAVAFTLFTYENLVAASQLPAFSELFAVGDCATRKRELMAFLAHTSHETNGGWATAPCHAKSYGLCFVEEVSVSHPYCEAAANCQSDFGYPCPCAPGKSYHGRGAIQLSWNYNYAQFSHDVYGDDRILVNPDLVLQDGVTAWASAMWFWNKPQYAKPSCHAVMAGQWTPDQSVGYKSGFGATTHIINGGLECGCQHELFHAKAVSRVDFFRRYLRIAGLDPATQACADNANDTLLCRGMPERFAGVATSCGAPPSDSCTAGDGGGSVGGGGSGGGSGGSGSGGGSGGSGGGEVSPPAPAGDCVIEKECSINAWCNDPTYVDWCKAHTNAECPKPQCKVLSSSTPQTPPPQTPPQTPPPQNPPPQTQPPQTPPPQTPPPQNPPPSSGSACVQQMDCAKNPWCSGDYVKYCADMNAHDPTHCPAPHCTFSNQRSLRGSRSQ